MASCPSVLSVCWSVWPSVTLRYYGHIVKSSKIIAHILGLGSLLSASPTIIINLVQGKYSKISSGIGVSFRKSDSSKHKAVLSMKRMTSKRESGFYSRPLWNLFTYCICILSLWIVAVNCHYMYQTSLNDAINCLHSAHSVSVKIYSGIMRFPCASSDYWLLLVIRVDFLEI